MIRYMHLLAGSDETLGPAKLIAEREGVRITGGGSRIIGVSVSLKQPITDEHSPPCGFKYQSGAKDHVLDGCSATGMLMRLGPGDYWQGDGVGTEDDCSNIDILHFVARNCTDRGFDLKHHGGRLVNPQAIGCARSFGLWSDREIEGELSSVNPIKRGGTGMAYHIGVYRGAVIHIPKLRIRSTNKAPIFCGDAGGGKVVIGSYSIEVPPGTPPTLCTKGSTLSIDWGPQGAPSI